MFWQVLSNGIFSGCGYILVALGFSLVFGILNIINVAHSLFYALGCYFFYTMSMKLGLGFGLSVLLTIICVIIAGLIVEKTIFTRLRTKGHIMQIIAANGLAILMLDAIRIFWTADSIKMTTPFLDTKYNVGNVVFTQQRLFIVIAAILAITIVILILYKSRFGLMMRALPQDNMAATLNGINISLVSSGTFALGCVLAVFGAVTIGPLYTLVPTVGTILDNRIIAAIILGGIGSVPGTVIAALFIGIIEAMTAGYVVTGYDTIIVFSVLILTLIFRPKGLFGKIG